ncbi:bifunctional 4-hydroxy-2-oxoglutarate aldolase/2-dehydro-3-deoxy-phosphogluconate aldolase [Thiothrix nivea]|uniref:2-dehydro-3-deoxy-phosphogluconate aldolase n=1 Tax=Thiothrix nivea (strain ATCC 35100 / DSM 5205 / JP2) TaxID=870187 RepID=A0A656HIP0_THINJ|nr:bifunctional 4-hydroxy-2-oxoglutarate aldolase/2-dehydro-3-deoxy-phosphogluconate aldolase [Thiothrix nivea]EIJ36327.1 2-dehydro-3-deoxyphosphogluconate aldolase/4-hydroxy-2-oxoglutarate aldolase [Thiothrix nivea DSM 5205]
MSTPIHQTENMALPQILGLAPVMPVIVIEDLAHAVPLAKALVAGGLRVLEVTLRTPVAMQAVAMIAAEVPEAVVGVGTLTRPEQFAEAEAVGAQFAVSPGLTSALVVASKQSAMPLLPGIFTPGEAMQAFEDGFRYLKLFPAKQAGGLGMLKALGGPLPELSFCPTGGISSTDFRDYLALPNVVCVGGSWVASLELMRAGDWQAITQLAAEATA